MYHITWVHQDTYHIMSYISIVPPQICNMIYAFDQSRREKKFLNHFHKQLKMYQFS